MRGLALVVRAFQALGNPDSKDLSPPRMVPQLSDESMQEYKQQTHKAHLGLLQPLETTLEGR